MELGCSWRAADKEYRVECNGVRLMIFRFWLTMTATARRIWQFFALQPVTGTFWPHPSGFCQHISDKTAISLFRLIMTATVALISLYSVHQPAFGIYFNRPPDSEPFNGESRRTSRHRRRFCSKRLSSVQRIATVELS